MSRFEKLDVALLVAWKRIRSAWHVLSRVLAYILGSMALAVVVYALFALVYSTDEEKRLREENRSYEQAFEYIAPRASMLEDAITGLQYKDNEIYDLVFHSNAPNVDPMASLDMFYASDTIPPTRLASYTAVKADTLLERTRAVDAAFGNILRTLASETYVLPPMELPLRGISYPQVGAGLGRRYNPFYKAEVYHSGQDFIVERGVPVYAAADGVIGDGTGTFKNLGNLVEIRHEGGYVTRYAHLDNVYVLRGERVRRGQKIGTVGMTGESYAPHLHFEVMQGGEYLDPMGFLFASVGPEEYANMLYMSTNTMQSMD